MCKHAHVIFKKVNKVLIKIQTLTTAVYFLYVCKQRHNKRDFNTQSLKVQLYVLKKVCYVYLKKLK